MSPVSTDSESSSVTDSDIDELESIDLLEEAPTIPRDSFIQPLPIVNNDNPPVYSTLDPHGPILGDPQPRSDTLSQCA